MLAGYICHISLFCEKRRDSLLIIIDSRIYIIRHFFLNGMHRLLLLEYF